MLLNTVKSFLRRNRKKIFFVFFVFFIFQFNLSFAGGQVSDPAELSLDTSTAIGIINTIIKIGATLLALMTELVGWFLSPGWTTGKAIGFGHHLKDLWIMMSNIVYLIFAIILIWIAFMNILGKTGDWELKQAMPKFIVGVLIVPFSWFIVSAVIGLSSVLTVSVLSLPKDSFPTTYSMLDDVPFYTQYTFNIGKSEGKDDKPIKVSGNTTFGEFLSNQNNIFGIMNIYTFGIMKIDNNGTLHLGDVTHSIKTLTALGVKGIFDLLFFAVYFILMIALLMALFVRGIYIWIFMVLSPFFGLMYFFGDKGVTKGMTEKFSFQKFIGLAMMPVYVAGALSFGLLFILVAGKGMNGDAGNCDNSTTICYKMENDKSTVEFLGIKLIFNGTFSNSGEAEKFLGDVKGAFGVLLLQVFGLAILWVAVMAALGSSDLTKEVIAPIKQFGDSVGSLAMKAPTYMPIIPGPKGPISAAGLGNFGTTVAGNIDQKFRGKGSDLATSFFHPDKLTDSVNKLGTWSKDSITNFDKGNTKLKSDLISVLNNLRTTGSQAAYDDALKKLKSQGVIDKEFNVKFTNRDKDEIMLKALAGDKGLNKNIKNAFGIHGGNYEKLESVLESGVLNSDIKIRLTNKYEIDKLYDKNKIVDKGVKDLAGESYMQNHVNDFDDDSFVEAFATKVGLDEDAAEKVLKAVKKEIEDNAKKTQGNP